MLDSLERIVAQVSCLNIVYNVMVMVMAMVMVIVIVIVIVTMMVTINGRCCVFSFSARVVFRCVLRNGDFVIRRRFFVQHVWQRDIVRQQRQLWVVDLSSNASGLLSNGHHPVLLIVPSGGEV